MSILVLSTFPVNNPIHGGQHRVLNVIKVLENAGHKVQSAGVLGSLDYPSTSGFALYPKYQDMLEFIDNPFLMDDWAIGELFRYNDQYFNSLANQIKRHVDLIYIEQPWLFKFAERFVSERNPSIPIIYSQANYESELKYDILKKYYDQASSEAGRRKVLDCEMYALRNASAVVVLSEADLKWAAARTARPITLATTGVANRETDATGRAEAANISSGFKYVLFCGSAHPPNIYGFFEYFDTGLGCLSPVERMVVVGDAGNAIQQSEMFNKVPGLSISYINAGRVTEGTLQALIENAHAIILPIVQGGGGANLKTAEAILSNNYVIATNTAMRGFENYRSVTGLYIEDNPTEFKKTIRSCMDSQKLEIHADELTERKNLLWENTLSPLVDLVARLRNKKSTISTS
jgi:hypothetical protein